MNLSIRDFYNYYVSKCQKNCLDESSFTISFHNFWTFIQSSRNIEHIPIMRDNGTSYFLIEKEIIERVNKFKNENK